MSKLVQGLKNLKVKEVPGYVQKYAGDNLTPAQLNSRYNGWYAKYKKEVSTGRARVVCVRGASRRACPTGPPQVAQLVCPSPCRSTSTRAASSPCRT